MSIRCRCLLVREGDKPIWSDKDFRLPPSIGDWVQFEEGGALSTFRVTELMHTPGLEGVVLVSTNHGFLEVLCG
jgi:hypothetical protein